MKDYSLKHLPLEKRAQIQEIVRVLRTEATVEMVILFGSYAGGDWVEHPETDYVSDFDLLIIVESPSIAANHARWEDLQARAQLQTEGAPVHLVVHDVEYVNRQLAEGTDFFREIVEEGILLHTSGRHQLSEEGRSPAFVGAPEQPGARARFDWYFEKADLWLVKFENDLRMGHLNHAAFELHQAVETYYKTVLRVLTGSQPKLHDLQALGYRCSQLDPAFRDVLPRTNTDEKRRLRLLERAYQEARYEMTYGISREDLEILAGHVRTLRDRVESVCREFIRKHLPGPRPAA